jgi:adsorption protein B
MTPTAFDLALALGHVATVATISLIVVYLALGFDDIISDIYFWLQSAVRAIRYRNAPKLTLEKLDALPEQRIAIIVPCWHESDIIGKMVTLLCRSIRYANYDVFVGVYPNDAATERAVDELRTRLPNVHKVVNPLPGPTTKGQNLNAIFAGMKAVEGGDPFKIIVMHDVEDIVHPLSLKLYNFLIPLKDMVQLPVFPLERPAANWTAWTYADEFAENHQKDLIVREVTNGFVPGAGVGCAFGRVCLDEMATSQNGTLFNELALTEDYQFGLDLKLHGFKSVFVHQRIEIPKSLGWKVSAVGNFVATRAYFPVSFALAIRQKARWIAGICFQSAASTGWKGNAVTRYDLYRDRKGVVSDSASLAGYPILVLVAALYLWRAFDDAVPVPTFTDPLVIAGLWCTLGLTIVRLAQRATFVGMIYGPYEAIASMPRAVWGNVINGVACVMAVWQVLRAAVLKERLRWAKTSHTFPDDVALEPYRRALGEILLDRTALTEGDLHRALLRQHDGNKKLGEVLIDMGVVHRSEVETALLEQRR